MIETSQIGFVGACYRYFSNRYFVAHLLVFLLFGFGFDMNVKFSPFFFYAFLQGYVSCFLASLCFILLFILKFLKQ